MKDVHVGLYGGAPQAFCGVKQRFWTVSMGTYQTTPLFLLPLERWCPCCVVIFGAMLNSDKGAS